MTASRPPVFCLRPRDSATPARHPRPKAPRLPRRALAHGLLEVSHQRDEPAGDVDHTVHALRMFHGEPRLRAQELRLGQERGERIVELVLRDRREALQLRQ